MKSWRRLSGHNHLPKVILDVKFPTVSRSSDRKIEPLLPARLVTKIQR